MKYILHMTDYDGDVSYYSVDPDVAQWMENDYHFGNTPQSILDAHAQEQWGVESWAQVPPTEGIRLKDCMGEYYICAIDSAYLGRSLQDAINYIDGDEFKEFNGMFY